MEPGVRLQVEALLPAPLESLEDLGGGSIGDAWRLELVSGEIYFVKHYPSGPDRIAQAEAAGLGWLEEAGALKTAGVMAVSSESPLLILDWIEEGVPASDFAEALGSGLARLHAFGAPGFGFAENNFIGSLPQENEACESWPEFYAYRRIEPLLRRARDSGALPAGLANEASRLLGRCDDLCGPNEAPARLHGDLWSGNIMVGPRGEPVLIDPAVYGGSREVDLAMMRLFGGFPERSFDAYANEFPLADEAAERVLLYQLYPLLVHVILFQGGYVDQFAGAVRRYR
jgi:fructosamine-3-kinase